MTTTDLGETAQALVADGKGILAADETIPTVTKRLGAQTIDSTPESRRDYREMFLTTPAIAEFISGVILQDETIHQRSSTGTPLAEVLAAAGDPARHQGRQRRQTARRRPSERITEGLDGLRDRLGSTARSARVSPNGGR